MNGFSQQMRFSMAMNQRIIMLYDDVDDNSMMESIYYLNKLNKYSLIKGYINALYPIKFG